MESVTERDTTKLWHTIGVDETADHLGTTAEGLSSAEVKKRLEHYGPNEIGEEKGRSWWKILLHQFSDPLIYILLIAAVVTLLLRDYTDTGVILAAVLLNAIIGFIQELRAQKSMEALATLTAPKTEVVRDGRSHEIDGREIVPGDVVLLTSGSRIAADLRLFDVHDLHIDESAFTGESIPVAKSVDVIEEEEIVSGDQANMAFSGTVVTRGRAHGYVVRTGEDTELGRIASAVRDVGKVTTPLQENMAKFGVQIGVVVLILAVVIAGIGLLQGSELGEVILVAIAMVVSAIPESLPVVLTVTFAVGVRRMSRRNALIRSLPAVETLGSATVIGSDKTGTLTRNEMTVQSIWAGRKMYKVSGVGYNVDGEVTIEENGSSEMDTIDPEDFSETALPTALLTGLLANEAGADFLKNDDPVGDPTELALITVAAKGGIEVAKVQKEYSEVDILPFEPERRFMATVNDTPKGRFLFMKGAPEVVIERCEEEITDDGKVEIDKDEIQRVGKDMAGQGLRVLAMAYRPYSEEEIPEDFPEEGFIFAGLHGIRDPIRPEVFDAVKDAQDAGIRVLMMTGDHVGTASAIGKELGLDPEETGAMEGYSLTQMSDDEIDDVTKRVNIYARVAPEHKLRIVERLKAQNEVVAVTGDGVNDAPALRAAHLGIAMGKTGTDVAREASDIVLADDNFASITAAVEEGRVVFSNVRKVTFFLLSTSVGDVLAILAALIIGWPIPFIAAQILWVNLVTNGLQDMALAVEPAEKGLLKRKPRPRDEGVITWHVLERMLFVGLFIAAGSLGIFWWAWQSTGDVDFARTAAMTQLVVFNFFHVFNCRSLDESIFRISPFTNRFLYYTVFAAAVAQAAVLYVPSLQTIFRTQPLPFEYYAIMFAIGATIVVGGELDKWRNRKLNRPIG